MAGLLRFHDCSTPYAPGVNVAAHTLRVVQDFGQLQPGRFGRKRVVNVKFGGPKGGRGRTLFENNET